MNLYGKKCGRTRRYEATCTAYDLVTNECDRTWPKCVVNVTLLSFFSFSKQQAIKSNERNGNKKGKNKVRALFCCRKKTRMHDVKAHETANDNQTNRNGKMCMCIELHGILAYIFSSCFTLATATELKRLVCVSQYNCVFINTLTYLINFPAVLALKLPFFFFVR